jgi:hypothetical protein
MCLDRPISLTITLKGCIVLKVAWCSTDIIMQGSQQPAATMITEAIEYLLGCLPHLLPPASRHKFNLTQLLLSVLENLAQDPGRYYERHAIMYPDCELTDLTRTLLETSKPGHSLRDFLAPVYVACEPPDLYAQSNLRADPQIPVDDYESIIYIVEFILDRASRDCRLFVTEGGMIGTGFHGMLAGDVICILFGGDVPHIFRQTDVEGQYLLIGECYVDELMWGQAMEMGLQEQKFTLVGAIYSGCFCLLLLALVSISV